MKTNIYDFDETIYNGSSAVDFFKFTFKKKPFLIIITLLKTIIPAIGCLLRITTFKTLKEVFCSYVTKIDNSEEFIDEFIMKHKHKIKKWYLDQQKENDLVISASIDFYLVKLCNSIGITNVICTKYDLKTKKIIGENCHDFEKVKRLNKEYKNIKINSVYSDSKNDIPILNLSNDSYYVKGNKLIKYKK